MDIAEFHHQYATAKSHDKIIITCEGTCGESFTILKTRGQQNVQKNGKYLCRSCGQAEKHKLKPVTKATKKKIAKGVHEARFKKLIEDVAAQVRLNTVQDWELCLHPNWKEGILWTVEITKRGELIIANIFIWAPKMKTWVWKDVCETEGPVAVNCPLRFLDQAGSICEPWREEVREYNNGSAGLPEPPMPEVVEEWIESQSRDSK